MPPRALATKFVFSSIVVRQAPHAAVAARRVGECDDRAGVEVAVRSHELGPQLEPRPRRADAALREVDTDEPGKHRVPGGLDVVERRRLHAADRILPPWQTGV